MTEKDYHIRIAFVFKCLEVKQDYDEKIFIEFLEDLRDSSKVIDLKIDSTVETIYTTLWNRLEQNVGSTMLLRTLVKINPQYLHRRLDAIAKEADLDGWDLIRYITGYNETYEFCIKDSEGVVFLAVLQYFISIVKSRKYIDTVWQELAKTLIEDVQCRFGKEFMRFFPNHLAMYINLIQSKSDINQLLLNQLLKDLKRNCFDDFLVLVIGFQESLHLLPRENN